MLLNEVLKTIATLSHDELVLLRQAIDLRQQQITLHAGTVNLGALHTALAEIRADLSASDFAEIEQAMNEEYIEPMEDTE